MHKFKSRGKWRRGALLIFLGFCALAALLEATELRKETVAAFDRYVQITDEERAEKIRKTGEFLWVDRQPDPRRQQLHERLKRGEIVVERLETRDDKRRIRIPYGRVHHWIAVIFIPGTTATQTMKLMQDYARYPELFNFGVERAKLLGRNEDDFQSQLRIFRKGKTASIFFNLDLDDRYSRTDETHGLRRMRSTRIAEIADAGKPGEHEFPVGNDHGLLWRLNTEWSCEEKDGGIYLQIELIALSRNIPSLFTWLANPYIRGIPQEYLEKVLEAMRVNLAPAKSTSH
jgi:hypothetical protein